MTKGYDVKCPHCDRDFTPAEGQKFCPFCGEKVEPLEQIEVPPKPEPRPDPEPTPISRPLALVPKKYCPWEDQETLGFVRGMGETLRGSMRSPGEFFRTLPHTGGFLNPLLYALIVKTTGYLATFVWLFLMDSPLLAKLGLQGNAAIMAGLTVPVVLFLSVVVEAAALHASLFVVGGAREDFEATFRVVCYSTGPELLSVIPVVGGYISLIWELYLLIVGLRNVHDIGTGRAVLAVMLPALVCLGFTTVAAVFLIQSLGLG